VNPPSTPFAGRRGVVAVLALGFAAKLAIVLLGANRGLDIGDDGVFLLALNDPLRSPPLFEFYKLLAHFDPPLRFGLVEIRLLRVVAELGATLALARAVFVWARSRFAAVAELGFGPFALVVLLGALLGVGARGFGYNDMTNVATYLAVACLFRALDDPPESARARSWLGLAGFALGFQLFVKFPAAVALLLAALVVVEMSPRIGLGARLAIASSIAAGVAAAVALFVLSNGGIAPLVAKWQDARELNRLAGYGVRQILAVYWRNDWASHVNGLRLWASAAAVLAIGLWLLRGRRDRLDRALTAALAAGALVLAWGAWTFHAVNVHPTLIALFCLLVLLVPVAGVLALRGWRPAAARPAERRSEVFAPLLLHAALPFAAIAGTNVALTLKLPAHAAPLFVLLAIATAQLERDGLRRFAALAIGLLAVATSAVFVEHQVLRPYGLPSPLYEQVYETPVMPGLRVDAPTKKLVEELAARLAESGFRRGDPIVAFDFMPGLVWAVGGRSPGLPFYDTDKPEQNCWAIARADLRDPPFLLFGLDMSVEQHACIHAFAFPQDYRLVAALQNPYEAPIRYFFGGQPMAFVRLFAPRRPPDPDR